MKTLQYERLKTSGWMAESSLVMFSHVHVYLKIFLLLFQNIVCLHKPRLEFLGRCVGIGREVQQQVLVVQIVHGDRCAADLVHGSEQIDHPIRPPREVFPHRIVGEAVHPLLGLSEYTRYSSSFRSIEQKMISKSSLSMRSW
jgi:hypothetical protein